MSIEFVRTDDEGDDRCGEGCGREIVAVVDDGFTYCAECLDRLVHLGLALDACLADARVHVRPVEPLRGV